MNQYLVMVLLVQTLHCRKRKAFDRHFAFIDSISSPASFRICRYLDRDVARPARDDDRDDHRECQWLIVLVITIDLHFSMFSGYHFGKQIHIRIQSAGHAYSSYFITAIEYRVHMMADVSPVKSFEFDERITVDFKRIRKSQCDFSRIGCDSDFIAEGYHLFYIRTFLPGNIK